MPRWCKNAGRWLIEAEPGELEVGSTITMPAKNGDVAVHIASVSEPVGSGGKQVVYGVPETAPAGQPVAGAAENGSQARRPVSETNEPRFIPDARFVKLSDGRWAVSVPVAAGVVAGEQIKVRRRGKPSVAVYVQGVSTAAAGADWQIVFPAPRSRQLAPGASEDVGL